MKRPNFDRVARLYHPAEYLTFGPFLERCRFAHLPALRDARQALVLGDGDGRFLARLLAATPELRALAVDLSPAMLRLVRQRAARAGAVDRLTTTCADARLFELDPLPAASPYDLVVTHFFLDCLTPADLDSLLARIQPQLAPRALWLVSEFQIPPAGRLGKTLAAALIRLLYAAFRLLTGLEVRALPPWRAQLSRAGFLPLRSYPSLGGLLVSELWVRSQATAPAPRQSQQGMPSTSEYPLSAAAFPGDLPGIDPGPLPGPTPTPEPEPYPAPGPAPEPDPMPYPGPGPTPLPVT